MTKLRAVADVQFGPDPREWDLWIGYEAVFNRSFGHLPVWAANRAAGRGLPNLVTAKPQRSGVAPSADQARCRA